uniref:XPGN domain-containing protein n=1 Tax=Angiostrongylus cantonensis TaxID=6313 RepID=A0A0K0DIJ5_ANGCA
MGIVGLWPLLEPTCQPVPLEALEGMVLAVDVSIWIYQAQLGYPGEVRCPHLALLVSRLCKLLYYKIRPVFVFDGMCVPSFKKKVLVRVVLIPYETGEPSDEDDIVSMESRPFFPDTNRSSAINFLVEERERIRADRLKPSQIPTDSKTFSDFQLQRLLFRSRLNNQIQQVVSSGFLVYYLLRALFYSCAKIGKDILTRSRCLSWIIPPGEAEAQCVQLEKLGLVQGVISDDSDVWAFGAKSVYRHLFSKNKNVQHYESRVIKQCLGQYIFSEFVGIAVISGSDYSSGLTGIGVVTAIELLSEFAVTKSSIVNDEVVAAYFHPNVDNSTEKFRWRSVDIDSVRHLLYNRLGWDDAYSDLANITRSSTVE